VGCSLALLQGLLQHWVSEQWRCRVEANANHLVNGKQKKRPAGNSAIHMGGYRTETRADGQMKRRALAINTPQK
jgi:hypothetical protein